MPANTPVTSPLLNQWKLKSKMQSWSAEWTFLHLYIESFHGDGFGECCRSFPNFQLELCLFVQISKFCISSLQLKILLLLLMQMHCCFVLRCTVCSVQCAVCRSGFILQLKILLLLLLLCSTLHSQCTVWSVQCAVLNFNLYWPKQPPLWLPNRSRLSTTITLFKILQYSFEDGSGDARVLAQAESQAAIPMLDVVVQPSGPPPLSRSTAADAGWRRRSITWRWVSIVCILLNSASRAAWPCQWIEGGSVGGGRGCQSRRTRCGRRREIHIAIQLWEGWHCSIPPHRDHLATLWCSRWWREMLERPSRRHRCRVLLLHQELLPTPGISSDGGRTWLLLGLGLVHTKYCLT